MTKPLLEKPIQPSREGLTPRGTSYRNFSSRKLPQAQTANSVFKGLKRELSTVAQNKIWVGMPNRLDAIVIISFTTERSHQYANRVQLPDEMHSAIDMVPDLLNAY